MAGAGQAAARDRRDGKRREGDGPGGRAAAATPVAEWIASGVGLALFLAALGTALYNGLFVAGSPPDVRVEARETLALGEGWLVRVRAVNRGGDTAAAVRVTGRLLRGSETVEAGTVVMDFVPAGSEREGGLFFRTDPRGLALDLRAEGYAEP